jgi:hypothetical protein
VTTQTGRRYRISYDPHGYVDTFGATIIFNLTRDGTNVQNRGMTPGVAGNGDTRFIEFIDTPAAGSHTYAFQVWKGTGTGNVNIAASPTQPSFVIVEDIGPSSPTSVGNWPSKGAGTRLPWTPVVRQGGVLTCTVDQADLTRVGDLVTGSVRVTFTQAGSAANLTVDYPNGWRPGANPNNVAVGGGYFFHISVTAGPTLAVGTSGLGLAAGAGPVYNTAVASGDYLSLSFSYLTTT